VPVAVPCPARFLAQQGQEPVPNPSAHSSDFFEYFQLAHQSQKDWIEDVNAWPDPHSPHLRHILEKRHDASCRGQLSQYAAHVELLDNAPAPEDGRLPCIYADQGHAQFPRHAFGQVVFPASRRARQHDEARNTGPHITGPLFGPC